MTTVSVIIPTHDRKHLVARALHSVLAQKRPPEEVIVVDDGSTDATEEVVRGFPGVRYERRDRGGVSAARNHGLRVARGEWIALLDSDDEWLPEKLGAQLEALAENPDLRVCHADEIWIRDGRRVNPRRRHEKHGGWIFRHCLPLCAMSPSSILIHREIFDDVGTFDEDLPACEDYDLWLRLSARHPVLYVDRPLIKKYGGHADQLSRTVEALDRYRIRALLKILETGDLEAGDRRAALEPLEEKIRVYGAGAGRRGRISETDELEKSLQRVRSREKLPA